MNRSLLPLALICWRRLWHITRRNPLYPLLLAWHLSSYLLWCALHLRRPTPFNVPFKLVFLWPEHPPTKEQIQEYNDSLRAARQEIEARIEDLREKIKHMRGQI